MTETNEFPEFLNNNYVFNLVLMNDDLCFHLSKFRGIPSKNTVLGLEKVFRSVPQPQWKYSLSDADNAMIAEVVCPVCKKKYEEASERLLIDITKKYEELEKKAV